MKQSLPRESASMLHHIISQVVCLLVSVNLACNGVGADNVNRSTAYCGDGKCQRITGAYNKVILPHGYLEVTTIPTYAVNITIKQNRGTENHLALKDENNKFIINGINSSNQNGVYHYDSATFKHTIELNDENLLFEGIYSAGPVAKPVKLLILVKDKNPGITWEYYLPQQTDNVNHDLEYYDNYDSLDWNEMNTPQDFVKSTRDNDIQEVNFAPPVARRRKKFMWKVIGFSPCSRTCGGGIQSPEFRCIRDSSTRFYSPKRCMHSEKPVFNENIYKCNKQPCPPSWQADPWPDCTCIHADEYQKRKVKCVQSISDDTILEVDASRCLDQQPDDLRKCDCWTERKRGSRVAQYIRQHIPSSGGSLVSLSLRKKLNNSSAGIWLASEWYSNCSKICGSGYEYRSIFCDRMLPHPERCSLKLTPDTVRSCVNKAACEQGEWATTEWSDCSGDCFNLQKRRRVFCVKNKSIVDDSECDSNLQPSSSTGCTFDDVNYCRPRWFYSEWTVCSKTCGGGTQRRSVRCLEFDREENILRESDRCLYVERLPIYSSCNTQKCPEMLMDSRVDLMENHVVTCNDVFKNCANINKTKYCKLPYYQRHCCFTCREYL